MLFYFMTTIGSRFEPQNESALVLKTKAPKLEGGGRWGGWGRRVGYFPFIRPFKCNHGAPDWGSGQTMG